MNINNKLLVIIGIITALLVFPKLNNISLILLSILIFIGYSITKNYIVSLSIAFTIIYIIIYLNDNTSKSIESFKNKKRKKRKKRKSSLETFGLDSNDFSDENNVLDTKKSFVENYKSLTTSQVKGLNKDTQDLIATQKALIETLNNIGPTLKEGKNVLDTFKNYFGKDMDLGTFKNMEM